jgi:hypothetical protein
MEITTTYRLAVGGQYEFVEVVEYAPPSKERRDELLAEFRSGDGLPPKQWNEILDECLWKDSSFSTEEWAGMNEYQQKVMQEIKRSKKRSFYQDLMADQEQIEHIRNINEE